jgi:hypothetical protein
MYTKMSWCDRRGNVELLVFMIFMGLVRYPKISAYCSGFIPYPNTFVLYQQ